MRTTSKACVDPLPPRCDLPEEGRARTGADHHLDARLEIGAEDEEDKSGEGWGRYWGGGTHKYEEEEEGDADTVSSVAD